MRHPGARATACWEASHCKCWEHHQQDSEGRCLWPPHAGLIQGLVGCRTGRSKEITVVTLPWVYFSPIVKHHISSFNLQEDKVRFKNFEKLIRLVTWLAILSVFGDEERHLWVSQMEGRYYNGSGGGVKGVTMAFQPCCSFQTGRWRAESQHCLTVA